MLKLLIFNTSVNLKVETSQDRFDRLMLGIVDNSHKWQDLKISLEIT